MNRKFLIKAGSVLSLADARYFSSRMVDIIGFCFDPDSPNYINPFEAQEIIKWIEGPKIAGEFSNQNVDEILNIASVLQLDYLQWKGSKPDEKILALNIPKIISVDLEKENEQALNDLIISLNVEKDYLMLDAEYLKNFSEFLTEIAPIILNISSNHAALHEILEISAAAINFEVGNEIQTGSKSYHDFETIFELMQ